MSKISNRQQTKGIRVVIFAVLALICFDVCNVDFTSPATSVQLYPIFHHLDIIYFVRRCEAQ